MGLNGKSIEFKDIDFDKLCNSKSAFSKDRGLIIAYIQEDDNSRMRERILSVLTLGHADLYGTFKYMNAKRQNEILDAIRAAYDKVSRQACRPSYLRFGWHDHESPIVGAINQVYHEGS